MSERVRGLRLKLPGTSANLGPGFDAVGLALSMHLTVEAQVGPAFAIHATGRDAALCGVLENNLILDTYREVLQRAGVDIPPLHLKLHNEIPLGMGCGSSAAALLAGVALADHFGSLAMGDAGIVAEASRIEGHPDNVAACWYGGFTVSAQAVVEPTPQSRDMGHPGSSPHLELEKNAVETATFAGDATWQMMLAVQASSLATKKARALLPESYSKADAIFNVQRSSLLVGAFAQGRLDLLRTAMEDRLHQPYRMAACPLLAKLLPLAEEPEIAGVALSGAGPSVLVFLAEGTTALAAETRMRALLEEGVEILPLRIASGVERTVL